MNQVENLTPIPSPQTKHEFGGNVWLGFERLTQVPIQLKMVKMDMLTKEEKAWLKVSCFALETIQPVNV